MGISKYFKTLLRSYLLNPYIISWGILFILFWEAMGVYVFSKGIDKEYMLYVIGSYYGQFLILGLGSVAGVLVRSIYSASFSVRYISKFSRLNPRRLFIENSTATIIFLMIYSTIVWGLLVLLAFIRFNEWYMPKNVPGIIGVTIIVAIFMYIFGLFQAYVIIFLRRPQLSSFISFVPLMLSFISHSAFWIDFKWLAYVIPFNIISNITYYYYTDSEPYTGAIVENVKEEAMGGNPSYADPIISLISLIAWTILLVLMNCVLIRESQGVSYEELRLV